jgi:BirA family transcriptional regulator, biotin operon repressor / biotin---[acetyl-CoA-carboxylase] ligase
MTMRAWRIEHVDVADSTQDLVIQRAHERDGLVIVTQDQRQGRGRLGRTWTSPAGSGFAMSLLVRPSADRSRWPWLPLLLSRAASTVIRRRGVVAGVKWPNDVVVEDAAGLRKLGGVIATVVNDAVVLGIGVNVSLREDQRPDDRATSLSIERAKDLDVPSLVEQVIQEFDALVSAMDEGVDLRGGYLNDCVTIGQRVHVMLVDGSQITGVASTIDDSGALVVDVQGKPVSVVAGDVTHLR